ncbi:DoxX family protein [Corynebacterium heidelbergense]|uniref:DoxX family protein n=1 Tax=Corynebacterium heidelbergense TaxID=2055947 RepID=A0A364V3Q2_9CORY|nr:hypothetical protein [Corynebacterium heidelbergense]RAV31259.1 hypothetical protein DLJ54_09320 [Corynebacterium heidelbergense]
MSLDRGDNIPAAIWATAFGGAGILHMVRPAFFDNIVPEELPGTQRDWSLGSGVMELGLSTLLLASFAKPQLRPVLGKACALFLLAVWPGNIKMAWDWRSAKPIARAIAFIRVPLQIPMMKHALKIGR